MIKKQVLVVDDEESIRMLFSSVFTAKGYTVFTAESAEAALKILEKETILVMFLDLNLPGMNGVDLCREVMTFNPMTIAYAITGYASHFELSNCKDAGFEDYYKKPVSLKAILDTTNRAFEKLERWKKL